MWNQESLRIAIIRKLAPLISKFPKAHFKVKLNKMKQQLYYNREYWYAQGYFQMIIINNFKIIWTFRNVCEYSHKYMYAPQIHNCYES